MNDSISTLIERRYSRRSILKSALFATAATALPSFATASRSRLSSLTFAEVPRGMDTHHHVAEGYEAQVFVRWGDKILADAPDFLPQAQTAEAQAAQCGVNNDFIAYFPVNGSSEHGLLCVNHEYTAPELMFPGGRYAENLTDEEHHIEMQAHGCSVLEVRKQSGQWQPVYGAYNRRITATTPMRLAGPAAGHQRLQTSTDPTGRHVIGTFANCAGGQTPWNSYLTCEENFDGYFYPDGYDGAEKANHDAMTLGRDQYHRWDKIDPRFNNKREPNEPNRFGWVVEMDPFDPDSTPVKRTALGRLKHESATVTLNHDGRVVVYTGDDERFEHLYKFVSRDRFQPDEPELNAQLLDIGTLYVAQFDEYGAVSWHPLMYGPPPLDESNGFYSQADVLIETRRAAKLVGGTPMDRPEDVEVNPHNGHVYVALTKNPERNTTDAVNRRAPNPMGYVLELIPESKNGGHDHAALTSKWTLFLEGGNPQAAGPTQGSYGGVVSKDGWLACPDNLAIDPAGRLWITTDGQPSAIECADGVYAADTQGDARAISKCFFRAPVGAEVTGPCFTPDGKSFFISVQHPAERSSFDNPSTRWPDFQKGMPPRSAIVAFSKKDGGIIGS